MNCEKMEIELQRYLDGELDFDERLKLEKHLSECDACRIVLLEFEALERTLSYLEKTVPPRREALSRFFGQSNLERRRFALKISLSRATLGGLATAAAGAVLLAISRYWVNFVESFGSEIATGFSFLDKNLAPAVETLSRVNMPTLYLLYGLLACFFILIDLRFELEGRR